MNFTKAGLARIKTPEFLESLKELGEDEHVAAIFYVVIVVCSEDLGIPIAPKHNEICNFINAHRKRFINIMLEIQQAMVTSRHTRTYVADDLYTKSGTALILKIIRLLRENWPASITKDEMTAAWVKEVLRIRELPEREPWEQLLMELTVELDGGPIQEHGQFLVDLLQLLLFPNPNDPQGDRNKAVAMCVNPTEM